MITIATALRASMLDGIETFMISGSGQATLTLYQGDTALVVWNLGVVSTGTPFGSGINDSLTLSSTLGAPVSNTGTSVAGHANRFVIVNQSSATALSGTVSAVGGGGDLVTPSTTVTAATTQRLNSFVIRMSATGVLSLEASITLA